VKLSRVNTALLVAIILINGYIIVLPVLPGIVFWIQTRDSQRITQLEKEIQNPPNTSSPSNQTAAPDEKRLNIPSMLLDEPIYTGKTAATLKKGLWHRPGTATPGQPSNTVIVGHRLTYANPRGSLYHLNKVHVGDRIGVTWGSKKYLYIVKTVKVVAADETSIEAPTEKHQLTIYTCTPLWLPKDRLVVVAAQEKQL
jgi:LPXTG-site transpeptidase (sortase) family protein